MAEGNVSVDDEGRSENEDAAGPIKEYEWLLLFCAESFEDCLLTVLYPIFVRIYLDLLEKNQIQNAHAFFDCHNDVFPREILWEVLQELYNFASIEEAKEHVHYRYYWTNKLPLEISNAVKEELLLHFQQLESKIILPLLNGASTLKDNAENDLSCENEYRVEENADQSKSLSKVFDLESAFNGIKDKRIVINISSNKKLGELKQDKQNISNVNNSVDQAASQNKLELNNSNKQYKYDGPKAESSAADFEGLFGFIPDMQTSKSNSVFDSSEGLLEVFSFDDVFGDSINFPNSVNFFNEMDESSKVACTIDDLKNICNTVRNESLSVAPICIYTISSERTKHITACDTDTENTLLASAFDESSSIFLYDLHSLLPETQFFVDSVDKTKERNVSCMPVKKKVYRFLRKHDAEVTGLCFLPERPFLMSCSLDKSAILWSTENFENIETYNGYTFLWDITVSSVHPHFATAESNSCAYLFSFECKVPIVTFQGHTDDVKCVRFHQNGTYLATASEDKTVCLWNTKDGHQTRKFCGNACPESIAFSPDGKYLAVSYREGSVILWDLASAKAVHTFTGDDKALPNAICFDKRENQLLVAYSNDTLKVWDARLMSEEADNRLLEDSNLLSCYSLPKSMHSIKYNRHNFFSCITHEGRS